MAIHSINSLQNTADYKERQDKYILESLANLGQRYGVKGDSIKINELSLYNFFVDHGIEITSASEINKLLAVISKVDDSYSISLVKNNEITQKLYTIELNDNSKEDFIESLDGNDISIKYNSIHFKVTDTYYEYKCKQTFGTRNKLNYILERVNRYDNSLAYGLRIHRGHGIAEYENNYFITELVQDSLDKEKYTLNVYFSNSSVDSYVDEDSFWFDNDGDAFLDRIDIDTNSRYEIYSSFITPCTRIVTGEINFDGKDFNGINYDDFERDYTGIHTLLYNYIYDLKLLYLEAKEKFSTDTYGDINSVYKQILISLFDKITLKSLNTIVPTSIYIPFINNNVTNVEDAEYFSIKYACNSNSLNDVYFSTQDVQVKYVADSLDSDWFELNIDNYRDSIICYTEKCDRVSFFNFEVEKDDDNIDLTIGIITNLKTTLPYIDENGYWVLNDISTAIRAQGKNAGNPNIIIVESSREGIDGVKKKIIVGAKKEEILETLSWEKRTVYIEPLEKINLDDLNFKSEYDYFIVDCAIPNLSKIPAKIKKETYDFLENAIIINICDLSCVELNEYYNTNNINYNKEDLYEIYGNYGIITTIWTIDSETQEFEYIKKQENPIAAADFNYLSNINNLIQYAINNYEPIHPDNYEFTQLVFDSTFSTLKNNTQETKTYLYPNITNKVSKQYNVTNYNNDLNFIFKYNNIIEKSDKDRKIDGLKQSGDLRYFNTTYNSSSSNNPNIVTNSLYTYYNESTGRTSRYEEYIPNYNIPSLDLSEVLTRNETLLNRLNILSFDKYGTAYSSYIGTSVDDEKNILKIGTSTTNVNIGTDTMMFSNDKNKFVKQNQLDVDFTYINLNGDTDINNNLTVKENIITTGVIWTKSDSSLRTSSLIANYSYSTTVYTPSSRYIYEVNDHQNNNGLINVNSEDDNNLSNLLDKSTYNYCVSNNKLYTITSILDHQTEYYVYFSDGIYIPALLSQIGLGKYIESNGVNYINTSNIIVTSNMEILSMNNSPVILLSSSTNLYPDKFIYQFRHDRNEGQDQKTENITNFTYSIFTANPLKITYFIGLSKLHIHIEELYGRGKVNTFEKITKEYFN